MNRIAQYTAVFTLLLYKYVFYSSHSIVEIQLLLYRYFYRYFVGILPETRYFLLAFYRYFRETLDLVIFLRPRWQPCLYHLQMLLNHDGSLLPPLSERGINKMRKHGLASILSAALPPPGGNVKGLPRVAGILGKRHRPAVISHVKGGNH